MHTSTPTSKAFTLVEVMVSTAIIGLIMLVLVAMTNQTSATWRSTTEKIEKFQEARDGFEAMTRRLAQATLNTNWDYLDANGNPRPTTVNTTNYNSFIPVMYGRTASLRLISGPMYSTPKGTALAPADTVRPTHGIFFQAPFGVMDLANGQYAALPTDRNILGSALNLWGYYVEAGFDKTVPGFVSQVVLSNGNKAVMPRWRSRLMEFRQPSEGMNLYEPVSNSSTAWYTVPLQNAYANPADPSVRVLAENIVALVIMPKLSKSDEDNLRVANNPYQLCPYYIYDSSKTSNPGVSATGSAAAPINPKNQLPPIVEVTMVAVDERSAKRLDEKYGTGPNGTGQGSPYMGLDTAGNPLGVNFTSLFTDQSTGPGTAGTGTPLEGPLVTGTTSTPSDLNSLQQILIHEKVTYRIFTSNVTIRGAKWSRVQTK